jgi:hypothetical protein
MPRLIITSKTPVIAAKTSFLRSKNYVNKLDATAAAYEQAWEAQSARHFGIRVARRIANASAG